MRMSEASDEELMEMMKRGEASAFDTLFLRHKDKVFGYLTKRCSDNTLSEEIFQEVFEKIYTKAHTFKSGHHFLPWAFTITRNTLFDHLRALKKTNDLKAEIVTQNETLQNESAHEVSLDHLPERYRIALEMRYHEGKDFNEISENLKTTPSNARKIISRAVAMIKKEKQS
jgi:RNA polymerase sigma factor (sigma-70 family)